MARSFPGGGADTDKITVTRYADIDNLATLSVGVWALRSGDGGGSNGAMVLKVNGFLLQNNSAGYRLNALRWSTTVGVWTVTRPATGAWHHVLWTYSYSATANNPVCYIDGVSVSVTRTTGPAGTNSLDDSAQNVIIGNNSDIRCWNGNLAEVAIWNRILTADEARYLFALAANAPQADGSLISGCKLYLPIDGTSSPEPNRALTHSGDTGVVTGTSSAASPSLFTARRDAPLGGIVVR